MFYLDFEILEINLPAIQSSFTPVLPLGEIRLKRRGVSLPAYMDKDIPLVR